MKPDERALLIVQDIEPLLAGWGPDVQGAVLALLAAMWVSGFNPPMMRPSILAAHVTLIEEMIEKLSKAK